MQLKAMGMVLIFAGIGTAADDIFDFPYVPFDHAAIEYAKRAPDDAVTRLQAKLDNGTARLDYDARFGYLPSLLKNLNINSDSQMLVFAKDSFQGPKISPQAPRALYFNDDTAVGYVPQGDVLELVSMDPRQGAEFYTLDLDKMAKPRFLRRTMECLTCHLNPGTLEIPGVMMTSVIAAPDGTLRFSAAAEIVDSRTPFDERWGGWYVTGTSGEMQHRGNAFSPRPDQPGVLDYRNTQNLTSLRGRFDLAQYPETSSDMVALMTIEHQTRVTDLFIRLGWETRIAEKDGNLEEFRGGRLNQVADQVVNYMLFRGEAKMFDPVAGVSTFTKTFPQRGPRDGQGRSLRDFDLKTRMFRYPLSYMIYSDVFDAMPEVAKQVVYRKLYDALTAAGESNLSSADRRAMVEIVRDTKPNLPAYWK